MDKSVITNLIALLVVAVGLSLDGPPRELVLNAGLFALSGALTNWLAVHMLFERVPGFYGSGVIPARFEEFKFAIKTLVMEQFFNERNLHGFFTRYTRQMSEEQDSGLHRLVDRVDLDSAFESLVDMIMNSSFGGMLTMVGGREALEPLKQPFIERMRRLLLKMSEDPEMLAQLRFASTETLREKVETIVDRRLEELTPQMVKDIVQRMIRRHLGWLVVWGGVLGGLIGVLATVLVPISHM